jgi:hypothetical protein
MITSKTRKFFERKYFYDVYNENTKKWRNKKRREQYIVK